MRCSFLVHGNHVGACLREQRNVLLGILNHQMHIQGQLGCLAKRRHDGHSDRNVRHKVSVHHIHMEERCAASFHGANSFSQGCEVRGKNRGGNFDRMRHSFSARILPESRSVKGSSRCEWRQLDILENARPETPLAGICLLPGV